MVAVDVEESFAPADTEGREAVVGEGTWEVVGGGEVLAAGVGEGGAGEGQDGFSVEAVAVAVVVVGFVTGRAGVDVALTPSVELLASDVASGPAKRTSYQESIKTNPYLLNERAHPFHLFVPNLHLHSNI